MSGSYKQSKLGLTVDTPLGKDTVLLRGLSGEDRISGLFYYRLELVSEEPDLKMDKIVGKDVTATILDGKNKFHLNGIVSRFVQAGTSQRFTTYYAEVRPWFWLLTKTHDNRIFQEKKVTDIIKLIFDDNGFSDYKISTKGKFNKLEYCVQYQESCFDFVCRLMEDNGIFYFFDHEDGKHTMILADDKSVHKPRKGANPSRVKSQDSAGSYDDIITHMALEEQVIVGGYAMTDYDFEQPTASLKVSVKGKTPESEIYEYPGGYTKKGDGESLVKVRLESFEAGKKLVRGQSNCRSFLSGCKVTVKEHVRKDLNGDYILSWVSHTANTNRYTNSFEGFPAKVPYRPRRLTRKPKIYGAQTAIVVGTKGEEIFTDKYGRVKVQFHWDREGKKDEKSSCFIRVAHGWAGKGWGAFFLPRIGQEVIVSFLDGDPDRPIITGSVYNAEQTVPYKLPGDMTKSTIKSSSSKGGSKGNEFRFEDKKDAEEIYMHAMKDYLAVVENDSKWDIKNIEDISIGKDRNLTIKVNDTIKVDGDRKTTIKGAEVLAVGGERKSEVKGAETYANKADYTRKVAGNYTLKVTGDLTIQATGKITIKSTGAMNVESSQDMALKAGMNLKAKGGMNVGIEAGMNLEGKGGVQLSMKGGAMGAIDGGGMLTLKGGLVQLN